MKRQLLIKIMIISYAQLMVMFHPNWHKITEEPKLCNSRTRGEVKVQNLYLSSSPVDNLSLNRKGKLLRVTSNFKLFGSFTLLFKPVASFGLRLASVHAVHLDESEQSIWQNHKL